MFKTINISFTLSLPLSETRCWQSSAIIHLETKEAH